ncbi:MAG: hypothetical protein AAGI15_12560 [Pseudomonadota bacterium]
MAASDQASFDAFYLAGRWVSEDYRCTSNHTEYVGIDIRNGLLDATKIDSGGDRCVPTGSRTFSGRLPEQLVVGKSYPVVFVTGVPSQPACCKSEGHIVVDSVDELRLCDNPGCRGDQWTIHLRRDDAVARF